MSDANALRPIIIKRKKIVVAGGHHGGAWKVAYADFVTAMMAFFMLMWLLNATTESQRKGIADYFNPTIPVNRISGGGEGMFGGSSVFSEEKLPQDGVGGTKEKTTAERQARGDSGVDTSQAESEMADMKALEDLIAGGGGESSVADEMLEHIHTRVTDEGLIVEIFDLPDAPLFSTKNNKPMPVLLDLTSMIARVFKPIKNQIAINGYTRSYSIVLISNPGWDHSTERAHLIRKMLETGGLDQNRMQRVAGWSDRKPASQNRMSSRNNRLEIILLRSDKAVTGK